ncbi:MAG: alpha/beta hydrolase [Dethiosulfatibacter sp.]|nr:alpha/beta hydrolase [Dethiosulfatibacter sp.]
MATFDYNGKQVYYEIYGEGKPIVLLNGIMMSTKSWGIFVDALSKDNKLILLDFLDQGQSDRLESNYTHDIQVEVLKQLIIELGYDKVSIAGISYGAEIALNFSVKYGHMVERLVVFNASCKTSAWLKDIGEAWNLSADQPLNYYLTAIPVIYSPAFYNNNYDFMKNRQKLLTSTVFSDKGFMDAMIRLTKSSESYNLEEQLKQVRTRTLIVSSENDMLTPKEEQYRLHQLLENSELILIPGAGHASMYEKPALFVTLVLGFINAESLDMSIL